MNAGTPVSSLMREFIEGVCFRLPTILPLTDPLSIGSQSTWMIALDGLVDEGQASGSGISSKHCFVCEADGNGILFKSTSGEASRGSGSLLARGT